MKQITTEASPLAAAQNLWLMTRKDIPIHWEPIATSAPLLDSVLAEFEPVGVLKQPNVRSRTLN